MDLGFLYPLYSLVIEAKLTISTLNHGKLDLEFAVFVVIELAKPPKHRRALVSLDSGNDERSENESRAAALGYPGIGGNRGFHKPEDVRRLTCRTLLSMWRAYSAFLYVNQQPQQPS